VRWWACAKNLLKPRVPAYLAGNCGISTTIAAEDASGLPGAHADVLSIARDRLSTVYPAALRTGSSTQTGD